MSIYSIKDLERLSGIKAHTLRVWEKRYEVLHPQRTETNVRYYLEKDLQILLKVVFLYKKGYKISKIAKFSNDEISEHVLRHMDLEEGLDGKYDALTLSIVELDRFTVEEILNHSIQSLGFLRCLLEIICPLLEKINLLWITGAIQQYHENFLIQIIRQKIYAEIDCINPIKEEAQPTVFIFSNSEDGQDITLLLSDYYLKANGFSTTNLGAEVDLDILEILSKNHQPDFILLMYNNSSDSSTLEEYIKELRLRFEHTKIWVSGYLFSPVLNSPDFKLIHNIFQLFSFAEKEYASYKEQISQNQVSLN